MNKWANRKTVLTVALLAVIVLALSTALDKTVSSIPVMRTVDQKSGAYLDDWAGKAITTFALSKGINSALSVVEDSQVQVSIGGSGVDLALGEVVRPLNEMIDKVADIALASAVSLEIQRAFVKIGGWVGLRWLVTLSMVCFLVDVWVGSLIRLDLRRLANTLLVIAIAARILIPLAVSATGYIGDRFTESSYKQAEGELQQLKTEAKNVVKAMQPPAEASETPSKGLLGSLQRKVDAFATAVKNTGEATTVLLNRFASMADAYNKAAVTYIAVFILQTMLLPILILWGLVRLLGLALNPAAAAVLNPLGLASRRNSEAPIPGTPISEGTADAV